MIRACASLIALAALAACDPSAQLFEVDIGDTDPNGATIELFGEERIMTRNENTYLLRVSIEGDGSGRITVYYPNDVEVDCEIGYVTRGMAEPMRFEIRNGECREVTE